MLGWGLFGASVLGAFVNQDRSKLVGWACVAGLIVGLILSQWGDFGWRSPEERKQYMAEVFGFWPGVNKKRQTFEILAWGIFCIGSPLLMAKALERNPILDEIVLYGFPALTLFVMLSCSRVEYFTTLGSIRATGEIKFMMLLGLGLVVSSFCFGVYLWFK